MPSPEIGDWVVALALTSILLWASASDLLERKIPNWTVLAVAALFAPWALLHWGVWTAWALAAGLISLAVGIGLYALGVIGAGDAKLFAAVALFVGMDHLLAFAVATAFAGGAIAVASLASRPQRALAMFMLRGRGDFGRGVPYGIAISVGGCLVVWAWLLHATPPFQLSI